MRRSYYVAVIRHDKQTSDTGEVTWTETEVEKRSRPFIGKERADVLNGQYRTHSRFYSARMVWS